MAPRFVRYRPAFLQRVVILLTVMTIICAFTAVLADGSTDFSGKLCSVVLFVCAAILGPITLFVLLPRMITKKPVMTIADDGLKIGYLILEKPSLLPWTDIDSIRSVEGQICLMHSDLDRYYDQRPACCRWVYLADVSKYGTFLRLSPIAFDITLDEFMSLVPDRLRSTGSAPGDGKAEEDLVAYLKTLSLMRWVEPDPEEIVRTTDDYHRKFSKNLVGSWSNDDCMMPSPVTKDVVFKEDGTGCIAGVFFTAYSGDFVWREKDEFLIEICSINESPIWIPLSWTFSSEPVQLFIEEAESADDAESAETPELISELLYDSFFLSQRNWDFASTYEVPSEAEEISVGGEPAWIVKGEGYWNLFQGKCKVAVANTASDDGANEHFFSVQFVGSKTGKNFIGSYDHAPGHVDRERFLEVAERISRGVRRAAI